MKSSFLPLLALIIPLTSCDKVKEAAAQKAEEALKQVKTQVQEDIKAKIEDVELLKSGREFSEQAKAALAEVNLDSLKSEVEQVKAAVASGNYAQAEELSKAVDSFLGTDVVSDTVTLMKIRTEEGKEAANRKLAELSLASVTPEQRAYFEKMGGYLTNLDPQNRDEAVKMLALSVASGCEAKFGEGGGALALLALKAVFPEIVTESGSK